MAMNTFPSESHRGCTAAGCLLLSVDRKKCLLVQQSHGMWSLPKGSLKTSTEPYEDCMHRELYEETGISLDHVRYCILGKYKWKRYLIFVIQLLQSHEQMTLKIQDFNEISKVEWVDVYSTTFLPQNHVTKKIILRHINKNRSQHQRGHWGFRRETIGDRDSGGAFSCDTTQIIRS